LVDSQEKKIAESDIGKKERLCRQGVFFCSGIDTPAILVGLKNK
jgi:hypothetical protein